MIQRVKSASVTVDGQLISTIGKGLLVLAAIAKEDTAKEVESMAAKVLKVKLWDDEQGGGKWKKNVQEINGEVLCGKHHITWLPQAGECPFQFLTLHLSLSIHPSGVYKERQQTQLPCFCRSYQRQRALRSLLQPSTEAVSRGPCQGWCVPSHDGRGSGQ